MKSSAIKSADRKKAIIETVTMKAPEELVPMLCYEDIEQTSVEWLWFPLSAIWKTDNYPGQSGRGKNLFCHDADRSLYEPEDFSEYGRD